MLKFINAYELFVKKALIKHDFVVRFDLESSLRYDLFTVSDFSLVNPNMKNWRKIFTNCNALIRQSNFDFNKIDFENENFNFLGCLVFLGDKGDEIIKTDLALSVLKVELKREKSALFNESFFLSTLDNITKTKNPAGFLNELNKVLKVIPLTYNLFKRYRESFSQNLTSYSFLKRNEKIILAYIEAFRKGKEILSDRLAAENFDKRHWLEEDPLDKLPKNPTMFELLELYPSKSFAKNFFLSTSEFSEERRLLMIKYLSQSDSHFENIYPKGHETAFFSIIPKLFLPRKIVELKIEDFEELTKFVLRHNYCISYDVEQFDKEILDDPFYRLGKVFAILLAHNHSRLNTITLLDDKRVHRFLRQLDEELKYNEYENLVRGFFSTPAYDGGRRASNAVKELLKQIRDFYILLGG